MKPRDLPGYQTTDGRLIEIKVPQNPSHAFRQGFEAGLLAAVVCCRDSGVRMLVHATTVHMLAHHHFDEAMRAAVARFLAPAKGRRRPEVDQ